MKQPTYNHKDQPENKYICCLEWLEVNLDIYGYIVHDRYYVTNAVLAGTDIDLSTLVDLYAIEKHVNETEPSPAEVKYYQGD